MTDDPMTVKSQCQVEEKKGRRGSVAGSVPRSGLKGGVVKECGRAL